MRHLLADLAVYVLAGGLILAGLTWAWLRSEQLVLTSERDAEQAQVATDAETFEWVELGERVYLANCANCHTTDGRGRNMYPPLTNLSGFAETEEGRRYLTHLVLYGLRTGAHAAPMPPMPHLSDVQIAAVNNHLVTAFDEQVQEAGEPPRLFVPPDVAAERGLGLRERDVERPVLR